MKATVSELIDGLETTGTSVELANDESWAELTVHVKGTENHVKFKGTPRQLRALGRAILEGCVGLKYR